MKKLYYPKENPTHYWEYWDNDDGSFFVHWGELGSQGKSKTLSRKLFKSAQAQITQLETAFISKGYAEIDFDDQHILLVEHVVDGFGTDDDLNKRYSLQEELDEILGWAGLGHCGGGSIGSGCMEVCCVVVDFELAKRVISEQLLHTDFADYSRIYKG